MVHPNGFVTRKNPGQTDISHIFNTLCDVQNLRNILSIQDLLHFAQGGD